MPFLLQKNIISYTNGRLQIFITQDEVHLPCKLKEDQYKETQIRETLNGIKGLIAFTWGFFTVSTFLLSPIHWQCLNSIYIISGTNVRINWNITLLFLNIDMSSKGFNLQYKILDKTPIGVCYTLIMTYLDTHWTSSRCPSHLHAYTPRNCFQY